MRQGIPKIKIPVRPEELTIETAETYLGSIFTQFEANAIKIRECYDVYCLDHPILRKTRVYGDTQINSIVLIPDLRAAVDWKTGHCVGNPIKYAQNKTSETNDINVLNKYVRSARQRSVDKEVTKWAYATGVGYYFIEPRSGQIDITVDAPYELYCREADTCTKVYSSFGSGAELFDILYTTYEEIDKDQIKNTVRVLDVYFHDFLFTYEQRNLSTWTRIKTQSRGTWKPLPLVEKRSNADGIGIVAMGKQMQEALDTIVSSGLDNVQDIVNAIFVYKNADIGATPKEMAANHTAMKMNGAISIKSSSKDFPADIDVLTSKLSLSEMRVLFEILNEKFHATIGVPMEMSGTNSGGTTKSGSEVANGYDNAYNRMLDDINTFLMADTELLEKIMWICKHTPNNQIDNLAPSEIEIKYSPNLTDNMLTKSQSYVSFIQSGMPPSMALRYTRLSNDPEAEGEQIERYMQRLQAQRAQLQIPDSTSQEEL